MLNKDHYNLLLQGHNNLGISFYFYNTQKLFGKSGKAFMVEQIANKHFDGFYELSSQFFCDSVERIEKHSVLPMDQFKKLMFKEFDFWFRNYCNRNIRRRQKTFQSLDENKTKHLEAISVASTKAHEEEKEFKMLTDRMEMVVKFLQEKATEDEQFIMDYVLMDNKTKSIYWGGKKTNDRKTITLPSGKTMSKQTFYNLVSRTKEKVAWWVEAQLSS